MRLAIIGAGPGGYVAAIKGAQLGAQVTVIEKYEVGGTCLNWGCIPTKSFIASAEAINKARRLGEYGIDWSGRASPDILKIIERKDRIVSTQVKGIRAIFKSRGIRLVRGKGTLVAKDKIEITKDGETSENIEADRVIIATGSSPAALPMLSFDGESILSSDDALNMQVLPASLIIVGAGAIGCEFACIFSEFGVDVTIVELLDRAVASEDREISDILERELKKKKIRLITGVAVERVEKRSGVHVFLNNGKELTAEKLLVSIGRNFNTGDLGLEGLGIDKGAKGEIRADNRLETNVRGVFAVGDAIGGMMLAHVASREGVVAASNACGIDAVMDYSAVPAAIFTSPEIGSVGLREFQAKERGLNIKTGRFQFRSIARAHTMGDIAGIIKIVADADTDKVLGVHIIGPNASELVHQGSLAIKAGLRAQEVAGMVHAHPTLSEGIMEAMADVNGDSIHAVRQYYTN